jgi:ethanolamine utilization cobalamin adenosyltransferase
VDKTHPRIAFRGKLDTAQSLVIECQITAREKGYTDLIDELEIVLQYLQAMMKADVTEEPLPPLKYLHLSEAEVREMSHHPGKYFDVTIFTHPTKEDDILVAKMNTLRCVMRETELAAMEAFYDKTKKQPTRADMLKGCNRLNSVIFIIMCKLVRGDYEKGKIKHNPQSESLDELIRKKVLNKLYLHKYDAATIDVVVEAVKKRIAHY